MSAHKLVHAPKAPAAPGPFSHATTVGPWVFVSGMGGLDPKTGQVISDDVIEQSQQTIVNLKAILEAAGATLADVVKATVYVTDMADYPRINKVYDEAFAPNKPARTCVAVSALPVRERMKIDLVAYRERPWSGMNALPQARMTVDEYLVWAEGQPGRYELCDGTVFAMAPEGAGHAKVKGAVHGALVAGIRARRLPCHALPDGMTVRVDAATAYEPDALAYCGQEVAPSALEIPNPVIVVEVISPSTRRIDTSAKVVGYFRLPSVAHYLILDPTQPLILHHTRGTGETILTRIVREGIITLAPPGLELAVADVYAGT